MGKLNKRKDLWQRTSRSLLVVSLAVSLAFLGCTTNHNVANGNPLPTGPDLGTAPTSGVTTGGESYTPPVPPPMTSSYSRPDPLPAPSQRTIRRSPAEAAAIMAQLQPSRSGRYLGVSNPDPNRVVVDPQSNVARNPAAIVNPQLTINSSISSQPQSAIISGAGEVAGADATGTVAPVTITGTGPVTGTGVLPNGTGTLPIVASSRVPTVTEASVGAPIRVTRSGNSVTVTNVGTGRSQ